jgi:hypothetical protein
MQQQPSAVFRNKRNGIFPSQEVWRYCKKAEAADAIRLGHEKTFLFLSFLFFIFSQFG